MPNPILDSKQLSQANDLLADIRAKLEQLAQGSPHLLFAYRRKIAKMLIYDERSGPNERRKLKRLKALEQKGLCWQCCETLPPSYNVLDRIHAIEGYTPENTHLICEKCDRETQRARGYR